jgi:hypothetical protein
MVITVVAIAAAFAGLGWWAWSQPFLAAIAGLILYVGIMLLDLSVNPQLVMRGLWVKLAIIGALVQAMTVAAKINRLSLNGLRGAPSRDRDEQFEAPVRQLLKDLEAKGQGPKGEG